jgi:hypothetical protein
MVSNIESDAQKNEKQPFAAERRRLLEAKQMVELTYRLARWKEEFSKTYSPEALGMLLLDYASAHHDIMWEWHKDDYHHMKHLMEYAPFRLNDALNECDPGTYLDLILDLPVMTTGQELLHKIYQTTADWLQRDAEKLREPISTE